MKVGCVWVSAEVHTKLKRSSRTLSRGEVYSTGRWCQGWGTESGSRAWADSSSSPSQPGWDQSSLQGTGLKPCWVKNREGQRFRCRWVSHLWKTMAWKILLMPANLTELVAAKKKTANYFKERPERCLPVPCSCSSFGMSVGLIVSLWPPIRARSQPEWLPLPVYTATFPCIFLHHYSSVKDEKKKCFEVLVASYFFTVPPWAQEESGHQSTHRLQTADIPFWDQTWLFNLPGFTAPFARLFLTTCHSVQSCWSCTLPRPEGERAESALLACCCLHSNTGEGLPASHSCHHIFVL